MSKEIIGVIPPIITPIDENEKVDEAGLRKLINHCIDHGIHGIFVCGSNGECMSLTQAQRDRAIQIALDECAGRVPVLAGCMDSSTQRVIENVQRLEEMGGTTAVVTPVFYARHATQEETVRHFEEISKNTNANLMIYNIPPFTGQNLTADTIIKISKIDKVIGVKQLRVQIKPSANHCIYLGIAVFPVPYKRISGLRQMRSYLMSSAGHQMNLRKCKSAACFNRLYCSLYYFTRILLNRQYPYEIFPVVFFNSVLKHK